DARDRAEQSRSHAPAMRAGFPGQPATCKVPGAIAQDHGASGIERCEDDLTRGAGWDWLAGFGIDQFDDAQIREKMETAGSFVWQCGALRPGHRGFGEGVGADDVNAECTKLGTEIAQFGTQAGRGFLTTEDDAFEMRPM